MTPGHVEADCERPVIPNLSPAEQGMSRISDALKQIKGNTWVNVPFLPSIERYVETGDPQALAKVGPQPKGQNTWWYWGSALADALRGPDAWEDEDRRVIHVLVAAGFEERTWHWLNQH